jgi:hypothetical protein
MRAGRVATVVEHLLSKGEAEFKPLYHQKPNDK